MISLGFRGFSSAHARVDKMPDETWRAWIVLEAKDHTEITLWGPPCPTKVEALMAAFDLVGVMQAAVQKLADDEGMADFRDSVELVNEG